MSELATILAFAQQQPQDTLALATVVNVRGSSYRRPGARMLISACGRSAGTISGGCLEGDVRERARDVINRGHSQLITYDSSSSEDILFGLGLGCNGIVQILIEPVSLAHQHGLLDFLQSSHQQRCCAHLATVFAIHPRPEEASHSSEDSITSFQSIERILHWPDGRITSTILCPVLRTAISSALEASSTRRISSGTTELPSGERADWLIETIVPAPRLFIFGGGDDAIPVVALARQLGWHITLTDARPAFANCGRFPTADLVQSQRAEDFDLASIAGHLTIIMTHSYEQDKSWLRVLLPSAARHISQIGPKARTARLLSELQDTGTTFTPENLSRLESPAGLDLGAETPAEVALSLIAGLQATLTQHRAGWLSDRDGPIHAAS